jgi:phosphoribosyl-AMP cyclohydrolase
MDINFDKLAEVYEKIICKGRFVIPVIMQIESTKEVLTLAYLDDEALQCAFKKMRAVFWSTSRDELWIKGSTSGQYFSLKKVLADCEGNSLLFLVEPINGARACHTIGGDGKYRRSCFYREVILDETGQDIILDIDINDGR